MKTLLLLRHAKSGWDNPGLTDHDRPLAPRGKKAAPAIGGMLRQSGLTPGRVLCSTARRARQTWERIAPYIDPDPEVEFRRDIYDAETSCELLTILRGQPHHAATVMLVGHNPALEDLARSLYRDGDPDAHAAMTEKYPTAALAEISFAVDNWRDVGRETGTLARFVKPKLVKNT